MPVHCPLTLEALSSDEFGLLDYAVMKHVFASQNQIGRLADERVYRADVARRLNANDKPVDEEVPIELTHQTFATTLYLDLMVSRKAAYEFKAVATLTKNHVAQLMTYLYLLDLPRGKLVTFRSKKVESRFVNAAIPRTERTTFSVSDVGYSGDDGLVSLVVDLVRDWGTSLSVSLYRQAVVHILGGKPSVERMIALTCDGRHLAKQRFHLVDDDNAFDLTAFTNSDSDYHEQLKRLLSLSPLRAIHWINIGPHCVTFRTIDS